jgi:hypothetical protein
MAAPKLTIGTTVDILSEHYVGHWGTVVSANTNDDEYTVSGGTIGTSAPIFSRAELRRRAPVKPPQRFIVQHIGHQITRTVPDPWRVLDTIDPTRPIVVDQYHTKRAA